MFQNLRRGLSSLILPLIAASLALTSCASSSGRMSPVKPVACPLEATTQAAPEPIVPDTAGIIQPKTKAEAGPTGAFLEWLRSFADWAHEEHRTADAVRKWCAERG